MFRIVTTILLCSFASALHAQVQPSKPILMLGVSGSFLGNHLGDTYWRNGAGLSAGIGFPLNKVVSLEAKLLYNRLAFRNQEFARRLGFQQGSVFEGGGATLVHGFGGVRVSIPTQGSPFLVGGIGLLSLSHSPIQVTSSSGQFSIPGSNNHNLAFNLGGGLATKVAQVTLIADARWIRTFRANRSRSLGVSLGLAWPAF